MKKKPAPGRGKKNYSSGSPQLDRKIMSLMDGGKFHNSDLLSEMLQTCFKVTEENPDRGDVRLLNTTLKELRYAFKVFQPYRNIRKAAVFGSARTPRTSPDYKQARDFAREMVKHKWMVITGASSGIMHAGNEGAGRENSFGVNIRLPFEQSANPVIAEDEKLINFKYFFTRKLIFIRESDATVLCPGGFGTHDEGFETMTLVQTGKSTPRPIICLDPPGSRYWSSWKRWLMEHLGKRGMIDMDDINLIDFTHSAEEAARIITDFYRNYHSMRYIRDLLVMRVRRPLPGRKLDQVNQRYKAILKHGTIQQHENPFEEETNEPHDTQSLTRISFYFNRRHFARLKMLIGEINEY
ncbi:MAG: LOG family protein [Candidatus Omnitrophica bacterium]|nr:LOG family protein [Candidatus Omnitrophota bacterium]